MISFKQYIVEAKTAPLYHGTHRDTLERILKEDTLRAHHTHGGVNPKNPKISNEEVISLTRNLNTALGWVGLNMGVVIELDQQKLSYNKKIAPVEIEYLWAKRQKRAGEYEPKSSSLYEEYVVGDIKPLSRYLTGLIVSQEGYDALKKKQEWTTQYDYLIKHPLLKVNKKFVNK